MKQLILLVLTATLLFACQNNKIRYTQDSEEIEIVKATINDYDYQEWNKLVERYNDTAQIFYNSRKNILLPPDLPEYHQNNDLSFSTRAFEDEYREYEMIEDNNGKRWVNFWGLWKGNLAANNKEIVIPVHITYQFEDGKIVREYGYWNTSELTLELQKIRDDFIELEEATQDVAEIE
ncbi:hypothetical protein A9Q87_07095 [Flavobacteriales bacterium 34_180_T64]|nr:hypothetical protein A9Q87_07095 [Flavobacteriales bacterium 34_180_T64]